MRDYVIHATVHYVVQSKETGETENGTRRPTLRIRAATERAAIKQARDQQFAAIGTEWWPVKSITLNAELVHAL